MALVKFGGGVVQMSGSIAGNTFARNRYGNYVRSRTKPVNPNSSGQQVIRAALTALTARWAQVLDADQRTAWNLYGSNVVMTNKLGESMNLSGFNHYLRSNIILQQSALTLVDDGPTVFELPAKDPDFAITAGAGAQQIEFTFNNAMDWANETDAHLIKFQGAPQNAQRNFFGGPWRLMGVIDGDDGEAPSSPDTQDVVFAIAQFQRQWVYARISRKDGRLSEPFRADVFVGA